MKVFLTGSTGLIGIHIANRLLASGRELRVLVRDKDKLRQCLQPFDIDIDQIDVVTGDINDRQMLKQHMSGCDAAIHAAGLFSDKLQDEALLRKTNVEGTENFLACATELGIDPVIYISSILALFPPKGDMQRADDEVVTPRGMYAKTKAEAEQIARDYRQQGAPIITVYPAAVHGAHDPTFSLGPKNIADFLKSGTVLVTQGGLAYTDVRDIAALVDCALEFKGEARGFMYGGPFLTHMELHALLTKITGRTLKAAKVPGLILRAVGRLFDTITALGGRPFRLTVEAADVLTRSVPCEDQPTIDALKFTPTSAEDSFRDLLLWMYQSGRLKREQVGAIADLVD